MIPGLAIGFIGSSARPPLDGITASATGCWGLRRLRSAYSGSCIRVRRSSDSTEQDIGFSGNELDTGALLSFVGAGSGFVRTWYDQSGSARDFAQTTAAAQPRIVNSGALDTLNGFPVVVFDGSDDFMEAAVRGDVLLTRSAYTTMGLARPTTGSGSVGSGYNNPSLWGDYGASTGYGWWQSTLATGLVVGHFTSAIVDSTILSATWPETVAASSRYDGTAVRQWKDGGAGNSLTVANIAAVAMTQTFALADAYTSTTKYAGSIGEFYTFASAISLADLNALGTSIATRGGISWSTVT